MHIGIVELCEKNHHSMIYNWIKIANLNKWKITLFTTIDIFNFVKSELKSLKYNVVLKDTNSLFFQIKLNNIVKKKKIKKIIYLTICNYFFLSFASFKSANLGITIHNANLWFGKNKSEKLKYYIRRLIIDNLKKHSSFFLVNSQNMKNYIDKNFPQKKPTHVMPFSLRKNKQNYIKINKLYTVVYPGSINYKRRKYQKFIKLAKSNPKDKFIVLGSIANNKKNYFIYNQLNKVKNIITFNRYLDNKEFIQIIKKSHVLFCDLQTKYRSSGNFEVYGKSKDSGISYLMNEFNMPSLLNKEFSNLYELKDGSLYFKNFTMLKKKYLQIKNQKFYNSTIRKLVCNTRKLNIFEFAKQFKIKFQ
jgi:hypothetical protein